MSTYEDIKRHFLCECQSYTYYEKKIAELQRDEAIYPLKAELFLAHADYARRMNYVKDKLSQLDDTTRAMIEYRYIKGFSAEKTSNIVGYAREEIPRKINKNLKKVLTM